MTNNYNYNNTLTSAINYQQQSNKIKINATDIIGDYNSIFKITNQDINNFEIKNNENFENKVKSLEDQLKKLEEKINKEEREKEILMAERKETIADFIYCGELDLVAPYITKVEVLKPGKVLRFTFGDDTVIKTVCVDNDTFDFKFAFFLAYAKYFWGNILTTQGIENKARDFTNVKFFNSLVKKGMKVYFDQKKKEEKEKAERKEIRANRIAKKIAKKEKAREDRINEMAEAIRRAKN